jgi:hypothetical protein
MRFLLIKRQFFLISRNTIIAHTVLAKKATKISLYTFNYKQFKLCINVLLNCFFVTLKNIAGYEKWNLRGSTFRILLKSLYFQHL